MCLKIKTIKKLEEQLHEEDLTLGGITNELTLLLKLVFFLNSPIELLFESVSSQAFFLYHENRRHQTGWPKIRPNREVAIKFDTMWKFHARALRSRLLC